MQFFFEGEDELSEGEDKPLEGVNETDTPNQFDEFNDEDKDTDLDIVEKKPKQKTKSLTAKIFQSADRPPETLSLLACSYPDSLRMAKKNQAVQRMTDAVFSSTNQPGETSALPSLVKK